MAYRRAKIDRTFLVRVGALVGVAVAALTLSFFGLVAFATGETPGVAGRLPFYVLGTAAVFVVAVIALEQRRRDGRAIIVAAGLLAVGTLVFLLLAGEGTVYAARNPDRALASRRVLYLVAAGLITTGAGYWAIRHWREVTAGLR